MGFRTEKFGPASPNTPDFPYCKGFPGGNDTHETCMNELEKCINFSKNLYFTLLTSIGGFRGPSIALRQMELSWYYHTCKEDTAVWILHLNQISQMFELMFRVNGSLLKGYSPV
jgi:hypothetical protein